MRPYKPDWLNKQVDVTEKAKVLWDTLNEQQKKVLDGMFRVGHESLMAVRDAVKKEINSRLEGKLWDSLAPEEKARISKDVARQLKIWDRRLNQVKGPYVPFSRFGKYAVVAKSKEYQELDAQTKRTEAEQEQLDEMRTDPDHYQVHFRKSLGEAKEFADSLKKEPDYKDMEINHFEREAVYRTIQAAPWASLQNLRETIQNELQNELTPTQLRQIDDALKDVYFASLAENSTRRHLSKRRNVPGMSTDLLYAFSERGKTDASFIANVNKNKEIMQSIEDMRNERGEDPDKARAFNEMLHRHALGMTARSTPVIDRVMSGVSNYFLLTSFRYYVQQFIQTPMVSAPYMFGRFGPTRTWAALNQTQKDLRASIPDYREFILKGKFDTGELQDDGTIKGRGTLKGADGKPLPDNEISAVNHFRQSGLLDVGLQYELGSWEDYGQGNVASRTYRDVMHKVRNITRAMEIMNRMTAGLAAYRMFDGTHQEKIAYAERMLADTHGDYTALDRPRLMAMAGGPGKLFFQFRRYSWNLAAGIIRQFHAAFKHADAKERAVARKVLGYMMAQTALVTGALGLPMVSMVSYMLAAAFGPPDEPIDGERFLKNIIGDENIANILLNGTPNLLGIDIQSMVGMENVFTPVPFLKPDLTSREGAASTIFYGLGGAFGGLVGRAADGVGHAMTGNNLKAMEAFLPGTLRTAAIAAREANQGITKKNGDMVVSPEEFGMFETMLRGLGIDTTYMKKLRESRSDLYELDQYFKGKTSDYRSEYVEAKKDGDTDKMVELRDKWKSLQEAKKRYGFAISPLSNLLSAETQVKSREQRYKELLKKFNERNN